MKNAIFFASVLTISIALQLTLAKSQNDIEAKREFTTQHMMVATTQTKHTETSKEKLDRCETQMEEAMDAGVDVPDCQ